MAPAMWRKGSIKGRLATREARSFLIRAAMHTCRYMAPRPTNRRASRQRPTARASPPYHFKEGPSILLRPRFLIDATCPSTLRL